MRHSFDSSLELLDATRRQFDYLLSLDDARLLISFPRILGFLEEDARLSAIVQELRSEVRRAEASYEVHDREACQGLVELVRDFRDRLEALDKDLGGYLSSMFGELRTLEQARPLAPKFPRDREVAYDPGEASDRLRRFEHWLIEGLMQCREQGKVRPSWVLELQQKLKPLKHSHQITYRNLWLTSRRLAGLAYERCLGLRDDINPRLESDEEQMRHTLDETLSALNKAIFEPQSFGADSSGQQAIAQKAAQLRTDLRLLQEELACTLQLGASHLALLRRFAAKCERFWSDDLRALAEGDSRKAEESLTKRLAEFLFDQGLNPLVDVKFAGLRPDILGLGTPIYVEAKQYHRETATGRQAIQAVREAADGWGRVRNSIPNVNEAFIVIFRRGGPRLEFETDELYLGGRRMYLVLADIGASDESGSRQAEKPILVRQDLMLAGISEVEADRSGQQDTDSR